MCMIHDYILLHFVTEQNIYCCISVRVFQLAPFISFTINLAGKRKKVVAPHYSENASIENSTSYLLLQFP